MMSKDALDNPPEAPDATITEQHDIVVFLDETGYPSLDAIDPDFPIFLLTLLICQPVTYIFASQ